MLEMLPFIWLMMLMNIVRVVDVFLDGFLHGGLRWVADPVLGFCLFMSYSLLVALCRRSLLRSPSDISICHIRTRKVDNHSIQKVPKQNPVPYLSRLQRIYISHIWNYYSEQSLNYMVLGVPSGTPIVTHVILGKVVAFHFNLNRAFHRRTSRPWIAQ
jgi:hypothetical protein